MKNRHLFNKPIFIVILALSLATYGFSSMPQSSNEAGWYFVREESIMSDLDYSISGKHEVYMQGYPSYKDRMYQFYEGSFSGTSFSFSTRQENPDGSIVMGGYNNDIPAKGSVTISWSPPPKFIAEGEQASIQIARSLGEHSWFIKAMGVGFFEADVRPEYSTRGAPRFKTPAGENIPMNESYSGTVTMEFGAPRGRIEGSDYAVLISLGHGYGYRYVYEWREGPQPGAGAVIPQPDPWETDQQGDSGLIWTVVVGGLGVLGVGGLGLAGAAAVLVMRARKRRLQNQQDQPGEQEVVGYILELSTNEVFLRGNYPQTVSVTCWKVKGSGAYEHAPEAIISVQGPPPSSNITVSPLSGQGSMDLQISLEGESDADKHQVVITGSGGGESTTAIVTIYLVPDLEIALTTTDGNTQMEIDGDGLWACAQITSNFDGSSNNADQRTPNIRFRVEGSNADWIELGEIIYEDEWQWVSVFARTPYAGAQLERGNPLLIAEYQDEQHSIHLQASMTLNLQTECQLQVSSFDAPLADIRYYPRDSKWHAPDLLVYWIDPSKGDEPVEPNFVYGFDDPPLTIDPPCMTLESFTEHAPNIYRMKFQVEQDLEQYFGEDLVENEGRVKLTVEAWDDKQEAHYAEIDYQVRPDAIQAFYFWQQTPDQKMEQREYYGVNLNKDEMVSDGEDALGVGAYLVRLDRMEEPDLAFEYPMVLTQPASVELSGNDSRKYQLQDVPEGSNPNRYAWRVKTEQDEIVFYDGTEEDLIVSANLALDQQRYPNYYFHPEGSTMEVRIRPLAVYLKLWVLPGDSPGTSEAGGLLYLPDKTAALVGKELTLDIQARGGASLTTSQAAMKTNRNGMARWVLDYHGLTWKNFSQVVFTIRCGVLSSMGGHIGTQAKIDIGYNVFKTLRDLYDNRRNKTKPNNLDLDNPDWETGSGFLDSVGDWLFPDFLSGPCVNVVAFVTDDYHYACSTIRSRIIETLNMRRYANQNNPYEAFNEAKHMNMNGIEFANYGCWLFGPADHHFAGIYLSDKNGGPLDDPRFIDPWWNQHWSDERYKDPSGLYTKRQELANVAAANAILGTLFVLAAKFIGWLKPGKVKELIPILKSVFTGVITANARRGVYTTGGLKYGQNNLMLARRFYIGKTPFPPNDPIYRW